MEFVEVGPERRRRPKRRPTSRFVLALMEGRTLLVARQGDAGGYWKTLRSHGYRMHTRTDPDGTVVWATKDGAE